MPEYGTISFVQLHNFLHKYTLFHCWKHNFVQPFKYFPLPSHPLIDVDALLDPLGAELKADTFSKFLNIPIDQFKTIKKVGEFFFN